jgi:hAT family C-terminal dimerisation region
MSLILRNASQSDFDRYFHDPPVTSYESHEDWVLQWWKANEFNYNMVVCAARDLLAIPGAEVDIERLFSQGRDILGIRRLALGGDTMRMVMLMRSFYNDIDKQIQERTKAVRTEHAAMYGVSLEKRYASG